MSTKNWIHKRKSGAEKKHTRQNFTLRELITYKDKVFPKVYWTHPNAGRGTPIRWQHREHVENARLRGKQARAVIGRGQRETKLRECISDVNKRMTWAKRRRDLHTVLYFSVYGNQRRYKPLWFHKILGMCRHRYHSFSYFRHCERAGNRKYCPFLPRFFF